MIPHLVVIVTCSNYFAGRIAIVAGDTIAAFSFFCCHACPNCLFVVPVSFRKVSMAVEGYAMSRSCPDCPPRRLYSLVISGPWEFWR